MLKKKSKKSCYSFGLKELWSCLTNGEPEIGCLLFSSFDGGKQAIPSYLAAYGYALALSGKTEFASANSPSYSWLGNKHTYIK